MADHDLTKGWLSLLVLLISFVYLSSGLTYLDKCYCPKKDPYLNRDAGLRSKMYELRREWTKTWGCYRKPVIPEPGVPAASVLSKVFTDHELADLETMSLAMYNAKVTMKGDAMEARMVALNESYAIRNAPPPPTTTTPEPTTTTLPPGPPAPPSSRKRRSASANFDFSLENDLAVKKAALERWKRQTTVNEPYSQMLVPETKIMGIHPVGGKLENSELCDCGIVTGCLRMEVKKKVAWNSELEDVCGMDGLLQDLKFKIELATDAGLSSSESLLNHGYAGTNVLACRLEALDVAARRKRNTGGDTTLAPTDPPATNAPDAGAPADPPATTEPVSTTTAEPENDVVACEVEITFGGDVETNPPNALVNTIMNTLKVQMGFMAVTSSTGCSCKFEDLNPPAGAGLVPDIGAGDIVHAGMRMSYGCADNTTTMIPSDYDMDSSFRLEVYCVDGSFDTSGGWPNECEEKAVCKTLPTLPSDTGLERCDDGNTEWRQGEMAYYVCSNPEAVLNDASGMNMYGLVCPEGAIPGDQLDFPADPDWPKCVVHPKCDNLPQPSAESKLYKSTPEDFVRVGEFVHYTCIDKADFYETDQGHTIDILCDNPNYPQNINNEVSLEAPNPWPICEKLPCQCLGDGLTVDQSIEVLRTSCFSNDTYNEYFNVNGAGYIIPKRFNCGSYKPDTPNFENKCTCPEMGEPIVYVNEMEVLTLEWYEKLADSTTNMFLKKKWESEEYFNKFFLSDQWFIDKGYLRTIVYRYRAGSAHALLDGFKYVKLTVEHQFRNDSTITIEEFKTYLGAKLTQTQGIFEEAFKVVPQEKIEYNHTCTSESLARFIHPKFVLDGADSPVLVGGEITVNCIKDVQLFTEDRWDMDSTDNTLNVKCRPDKKFDVPSSSQMPDCLAQCAATKPSPPQENKLELDTSRTSETDKLWEREELWYSCIDPKDGIAKIGDNGTEEGTDARSIVYVCNDNGEYTIPTQGGEWLFDKCIPRPLRCQCLGDFGRVPDDTSKQPKPEYSVAALDLYCRNESFRILSSLSRDMYGEYPDQVVPNKTRCGSLDPVDMTLENACHCSAEDDSDAKAGVWMTFEVLNIPFTEALLDLSSEAFKNAKYIVEKALDLAYIEETYFFDKAFVRSIAMRFEQGITELNPKWTELIAIANNASNGTNATSLDNFPSGIMVGEPIIGLLDPTPEGSRGVSDTTYFSSMVQVEVQFRDKFQELGLFRDFSLQSVFFEDWISQTLWTDETCFSGNNPRCKITSVQTCESTGLGIIYQSGFAHGNFYEDGPMKGEEKDAIVVGGTISIFCNTPNKRIVEDRWDDNPYDFVISSLCKPDTNFELFVEEFPDCKAWCPAVKAVPPDNSGLIISEEHNNTREYWEDELLTYQCIDMSLGIDASDENVKTFKCKKDNPKGRYNVPRDEYNETWPICQTRTTTVKPPIKTGLRDLLKIFSDDLIKRKTEEIYLEGRNSEDTDYVLAVTIPALLLLLIITMTCLCCTRNDNPLCRFCSRSYQAC